MKTIYSKILSAIILTILVVCINASAQIQPPKFLIINGMKEDANYVLDTKSLAEMQNQPGGISEYNIRGMEATKGRAEKVLQKIKQLLDAGTPESEMLELAAGKMTLGLLSEKIFAVHRDASMVVLMSELYQAGMGASAWLEPLSSGKKLDSGDISAITFMGERLQTAVKEAQKLLDDKKADLKKKYDVLKTARGFEIKEETMKKFTDSVFKNAQAVNGLKLDFVEKTMEDESFGKKIDKLVNDFNAIYEV